MNKRTAQEERRLLHNYIVWQSIIMLLPMCYCDDGSNQFSGDFRIFCYILLTFTKSKSILTYKTDGKILPFICSASSEKKDVTFFPNNNYLNFATTLANIIIFIRQRK